MLVPALSRIIESLIQTTDQWRTQSNTVAGTATENIVLVRTSFELYRKLFSRVFINTKVCNSPNTTRSTKFSK